MRSQKQADKDEAMERAANFIMVAIFSFVLGVVSDVLWGPSAHQRKDTEKQLNEIGVHRVYNRETGEPEWALKGGEDE